MPILNLGSLGEDPCAFTGDIPADQIAKLKAQFDATVKIYSKPGQEPPVGFVAPTLGTWEEVLARQREIYRTLRYDYKCSEARTNQKIFEADTVKDAAGFATGQLNLDLFGQILSKYGSRMSASDKALLEDFFTNWQQTKNAAQVAQITAIFQKYGITVAPGTAAQDAIAKVQEMLPASMPDLSLAFSNPTAFYNQVLSSLHTINTSTPNMEAGGYLPAQGGRVDEIISNGGSQALTATDWLGVRRNQALVTAEKQAQAVSPLRTGFLTPTSSMPYVREVAQPASDSSGKSSIPPWMLVALGIVAYKLIRR